MFDSYDDVSISDSRRADKNSSGNISIYCRRNGKQFVVWEFFRPWRKSIGSTDRIMLKNVMPENEEMSALQKAMYMNGYGRYWHGYVFIFDH